MKKYIEAVQYWSRAAAEHPDLYEDLSLEHGLDEPEDLAVAQLISEIYGREFCEVEHDLVVYIGIYKNDHR